MNVFVPSLAIRNRSNKGAFISREMANLLPPDSILSWHVIRVMFVLVSLFLLTLGALWGLSNVFNLIL